MIVQNHVLHELCRVVTEEDESQIKEIKEIKESAGGTFCDFLRPYGSKRAELERRDFCVKLIICEI